jgi:precorrin-2 dehydrogenase/sirohydrochlorin ferrochelatase
MSKVCETWSLEDLVAIDEEEMEALLGYYESGVVPSFKTVHHALDPNEPAFDGSFGWW